MYLSRIQLNPRRREAHRLLGSPQRLHAAVLASFPDPRTGDRDGRPRILWRLDVDEHATLLYVVSPDKPDFAHLAEQAGWPTTERGLSKPYAPLLERLAPGQAWAFRLTANPSHYREPLGGGRAKRYAHVTARQQEQWLVERAEQHGFRVTATPHPGADGTDVEVPDLAVTRRLTHTFSRRGAAHKVTLGTAQFDGRLEVTDPGALRAALLSGIGPAKAYGCGLLTLSASS